MSYPHTQYTVEGPEPGNETHGPSTPPITTSSSPRAVSINGPPPNGFMKPTFSLPASHSSFGSVSYSSLSGESIYDGELNAIMAESWAAPTYVESITRSIREARICSVREHVGYIIQTHDPFLEHLSRDMDPGEELRCVREDRPNHLDDLKGTVQATPARSFSGMTKLSELVDHEPEMQNTNEALNRFLAEDMGYTPWTVYNLRLPGSICSFCGLTFTTPGHKNSVVEHIRHRHSCTQKNGLLSPIKCDDRSYLHQLKDEIDFSRIGSRWQNEFRKSEQVHKHITSVDPPSQIRIIQCDNSNIPHDQLLFILKCLDPHVDPKRPNNFFNALDLVAGNLLDRFPEDVVAQCMKSALAHLNSLYALNYGDPQHSGISDRTQDASKTCVTGQAQGDSSLPALSFAPPSSNQKGADCQQSDSLNYVRSPGSEDPKNDREKFRGYKKLKTRKRLLACPIKKNCEVHSETPTCTFKGAANISSITLHLKGRSHQQQLPFLALCRHCWEHTVSEVDYHTFHNTRECRRTVQPRYDRVAEYWHNLYGMLFPQSDRIPSPYTDETTWRPKHHMPGGDVAVPSTANDPQIPNFNDMSAVQSFLEHRLPASENNHSIAMILDDRSQQATIQEADTVIYEVLTQMLSEHIEGRSELSDHFTTQLVGNRSRTDRENPEYLDQISDRIHARVNELINSRRTTISYAEPQDSQVHSNGHGAPDSNIFSPNNLSLDQFPGSLEQFSPSDSNHVVPAQLYTNSVEFWQQHDPLAFASTPSDTRYCTFFPNYDLSQSSYGAGVLNSDGSHSTVSA